MELDIFGVIPIMNRMSNNLTIEIESLATHCIVDNEVCEIDDVYDADKDGKDFTYLLLDDGREFENYDNCHPQQWRQL